MKAEQFEFGNLWDEEQPVWCQILVLEGRAWVRRNVTCDGLGAFAGKVWRWAHIKAGGAK